MAERPLNPEEAALWSRVVATVAPLPGRVVVPVAAKTPTTAVRVERSRDTSRAGLRLSTALETNGRVSSPPAKPNTLDGTWDRRLAQGLVQPDRSIDLHGLTLDRAYGSIDATLDAAIRAGERMVLMVTGKARPDVRSGAGAGRGAIRAVVGDWLAASRHAGAIAAVRNAHPRHGGAGALYVILRRR